MSYLVYIVVIVFITILTVKCTKLTRLSCNQICVLEARVISYTNNVARWSSFSFLACNIYPGIEFCSYNLCAVMWYVNYTRLEFSHLDIDDGGFCDIFLLDPCTVIDPLLPSYSTTAQCSIIENHTVACRDCYWRSVLWISRNGCLKATTNHV